jgi:hypothetical protein
MAPLTRFANNEPEPPGSSANTVYMFIGSHFLRQKCFSVCLHACAGAHRTAERTVTSKLAAQGVPYMRGGDVSARTL